MAKTQIPGLKTGSGLLPKLIFTLVVAVVLVIVVKHPVDSANFLVSAVSGFVTFVDGLSN
ncbi:hypothetical protein [Amycolatopsis sp. H20-H5]|uniref:hypothetical protein n=1 Tax=Amycolatopsis sp. H20-H5 TaxID=3046309 RepID=UPI002DBB8C8F|nr:hypothetical protein [Amycolatopsis sp. H20-H5]MEC3974586.1 hypothetical protein [Amycolatopsis sp. H20-H5]